MFGNFFKRSSFGLDISDDSIKFVELIHAKNGIKSGRYGERNIPEGIIDSGKIRDIKKFEEILISLKKEKGIRRACVSLSCEDASDTEDYVSAFNHSGIKIKSLEHQMHSVARSIVERGDLDTYLVVNLNKKMSSIFIVSQGAPSHYLPAESSPHILRDEVSKYFLAWHTEKNSEELRFPIRKVILSGNGEDLPLLAEHLSLYMRHPVEVANVWANILNTSEEVPAISHSESFGYASALGAALGLIKR